MTNPWLLRMRSGLRKARIEAASVRHSFPEFVHRDTNSIGEQIPVFCFHAVKARELERLLQHLTTNGYEGVTSKELRGFMEGRRPSSKSVALTFDDGWRSTWTIAYPLLKKYGMVGICFLVPSWTSQIRPGVGLSLEDHWRQKVAISEIEALEVETPYVSWEEARQMQQSGVIEFQSHSLTHDTVFTSDALVDFVNPLYHQAPHKIPLVGDVPQDPFRRSSMLGMPLYTVAPRLTGAYGFRDDAYVRDACIRYVRDHGGTRFFDAAGWRSVLTNVAQGASAHVAREENEAERDEAIRRELLESKRVIEENIGCVVDQLCYPFYAGSPCAERIAVECGYKSAYWGWKPPSNDRTSFYARDHSYDPLDATDLATGGALANRRTNRVGDDPLRIVRLPGDYILRLPGSGRLSLSRLFLRKVIRNLG